MNRYIVWCPEGGDMEDDGLKISADLPQQAAKEWAEDFDSTTADYVIIGGTDKKVMVRDLDSDKCQQWIVSGETMPQYYARLVTA